MALLFIEGWEVAQDPVSLTRIYESFAGDSAPAIGCHGTAQLGVTSDDLEALTFPLLASPATSFVMGFAMRAEDTASINGTGIPFMGLHNDDGEQIRVEFLDYTDPNGKPGGVGFKLRVMRGATELATSNQWWRLDATSWLWFEMKFTLDNSTGSFEGRWKPINKRGGYTSLTWDAASSSLDTQNQSSSGANRLAISMASGSGRDIGLDEIYLCDASGSKNNDYLGEIIIVPQKPAGDGATTDWALAGGATSTQDAWDETAAATEDDERLTSDTITAIHLATMDPLVLITVGTVVGLRQDIYGRMETSGDLDFAHFFRKTTGTPAQTDAGTDLNVDSTTAEGSALTLEDDPNTATDWDVADLDSYQHGVRNDG